MSLQSALLLLHVLTAVLGVGGVAGIAIVASASGGSAQVPASAVQRMASAAIWSLGVMLLTGIGLLYTSGWAFGAAWWFRVAFVLFLVLGGSFAALRPAIRHAATATGADIRRALGRVAIIARVQCLLVAAIVVLMVSKPF